MRLTFKHINSSERTPENSVIWLRTLILGYTSLASIIIFTILNFVWGYYIICAILLFIALALAIGITFSLKNKPEIFKFIVLISINISLLLLSFSEGRDTWVTVYYFPLLVVLPYLVEEEKKYRSQIIGYTLFTIVCALLSYFIPGEESGWQKMKPEHITMLRNMDFLCALVLGISFSSIIFFTEQIHRNRLLKSREDAVIKAQFRRQFLAGTSHELRTSLNGIHTAATLMKQHSHSKPVEEYVNIITYCSEQMLETINEILDFEKIDAGQTTLLNEPFDLYQSIQEISEIYKTKTLKKGLEFLLDNKALPKNTRVIGDRIRLLQILNNLLSNAEKFTEKGQIILSVSIISDKGDDLSIKFRVADTGKGISPENLQNIFTDFWQEAGNQHFIQRGTGLGLTIASKLLGLMQAKLSVQSKLEKGTTFETIIPFKKAKQQKKSETELTQYQDLNGVKILLADDDPVNQTVIGHTLAYLKAEVDKVNNGKEALVAVSQKSYDIIFMDLEMPEMNGYEATQKLREIHDIPIVACTATLLDEQLRHALYSMGFSSIISKPFRKEQLLEVVYQNIKVSTVQS